MTKNAIRRLALRTEIARLLAQVAADAQAIAAAGYTTEDPGAHGRRDLADAAYLAAETAGRTSRLGARSMRDLHNTAEALRAAVFHVEAAGPMSARRPGARCYLHVAGRPSVVVESMFTGHGFKRTLTWLSYPCGCTPTKECGLHAALAASDAEREESPERQAYLLADAEAREEVASLNRERSERASRRWAEGRL